ncbi:MAG: thioredoxin domain-containing protein [Bacilli bacterium]|nr:thioredoxin domain-containing protein [Bacilli bacterium]
MEILYLNKNNFDEAILNSDEKKLVVFYADWCPPCKALGVVLDKFDYDKDITIAKVNIADNEELTERYNVYSVPTLLLFENKKVIKSDTGFKSNESLKKFIEN